ncbi:MAG: leucine--tRNA ligase [Parcubacteria group bacterium]|nr:leucine--tRNA ligase [Parcubacteria group bacterium]
MKYNPQKIEKKWQKRWEKSDLYSAKDFDKKPKFYCLVEFPYPSGAGLHVGHLRSYSALDAMARMKRMQGYNVLYPMGWDAFGLPTENFAIKTKTQPAIVTKQNIAIFKKQIKQMGLSFDWSREINTTDPHYYRWTQWIFLQLFKHGLAYKKNMPINWCSSCKIGLANEEVVDGKCERCGAETVKKNKEQWVLKITDYADRLIADLDTVDYLEKIKTQQINWIGKSEGTIVRFQISDFRFQIEVFTTRVDTIFGCTYLVVAPEHEAIKNYESRITNYEEVKKYIEETRKKSDLQRTELNKEKTGVELKGIKAVNPLNGEEVPIWIADYVLAHYGTGAVMAVPAHDSRDWEFAKQYGLPIKQVIANKDDFKIQNAKIKNQNDNLKFKNAIDTVFEDDGILINSGGFTDLTSQEARYRITQWLEKKNSGEKKTQYKLRDWIFSRQHYWGEPIPLVFCDNCRKKQNGNLKSKIQNLKFSQGELLNPGWIPISENKLPVKLPKVKHYEPTNTGESPLAGITKWVDTKCSRCGGKAKRETDTMPNWAGSSWYYLAYAINKQLTTNNSQQFFKNKKVQKLLRYWMPIDLYNGGMEHTTLHLLYSRFWNKFLCDIGAVPTFEPYRARRSHGMILAEGNEKMSKSKGNVVNPDEVVKQYGADTLRLYEMFVGPFGEAVSWNTRGIIGMRRFLERIWKFISSANSESDTNKRIRKFAKNSLFVDKLLHQTIKKVTEDIENMRFNTAISTLMILLNEMEKNVSQLSTINYQLFLKLLSPFAPHIAEELWENLGNKKSIFLEKWPIYNLKLARDEEIELIIQVNGKLRDKVLVSASINEEDARRMALKREKIKQILNGVQPKKIIFVKGRLVNIVL